jgi:hypothetical protein
LIAEPRVGINEKGIYRGEDKREQSRIFWGIWDITPVHEDVLATRVSMKITKHRQFPFFAELSDQLFSKVDGWVEYLAWSFPSTI